MKKKNYDVMITQLDKLQLLLEWPTCFYLLQIKMGDGSHSKKIIYHFVILHGYVTVL